MELSSVQAVQAFVRQAMGYIGDTPDKETKVELIKTLQTVTEGKVLLHATSVLPFKRSGSSLLSLQVFPIERFR